MTWIIRYDDGTTYTSDDGSPESAPLDGVLWVLSDHPEHGPQLLIGDFYLWIEDRWHNLYQTDLERHLRKLVPELKYGRTTGDLDMAEALAEAYELQASWQ